MSYGIRRLAAGAISVLALLALASPAMAARPDTSGWGEFDSAHFAVHYPLTVPTSDAQSLATNLEAAYATEVGSWGFNPPLDDGDSRVDAYIEDTGGDLGESIRDNPVPPTTSGYIVINPSSTGNAETAAHELFHILQYAIYSHGAKFLKEGTAEWAGAVVTGGTSWLFTYWGSPDQPLDCPPTSPCGTNSLSYARWIFFDYLSEKYGPGIVKEIIEKAGALSAGDDPAIDLQAIDQVLAAHGSSLTQAFNGFTAANAGAAYSFPGLADSGKRPQSAASMYTGAASASLAPHTVSIDHLAANYMYFYSGDTQVSSAGCGAATLNVSVDLAAGSASVPSISDAFGVHQLHVSGSTASISVPWTGCLGSVAALGLPNPGSTSAHDGQQFVVHASMTVTPVKPRGTGAPRITVSLPKLASVARHRPFLRFNVRSTGRGTLQVLLKSHYVRGSFSLRHGLNRLKLQLPTGVRGGRHQIVFTVFSTTGKRGQSLKRHVRIHLRGRPVPRGAAKPLRYRLLESGHVL